MTTKYIFNKNQNTISITPEMPAFMLDFECVSENKIHLYGEDSEDLFSDPRFTIELFNLCISNTLPEDFLISLARIEENADKLNILSKSPNKNVRVEVACNANTSCDTLRDLLNDSYMDVISSLGENPNLPGDLYDTLSKPSILEGLSTSEITLNLLKQNFDISCYFDAIELSGETDLSEEIYLFLAEQNLFDIREVLSRNPSIQIECLKKLADKSSESEIKINLAGHINVTNEILEILLNSSKDPFVLLKILNNPITDNSIFDSTISKISSSNLHLIDQNRIKWSLEYLARQLNLEYPEKAIQITNLLENLV